MDAATKTAAAEAAGADPNRRRSSHRRRRRPDRTTSQLDRRLVQGIAAVAAIAAVFSDARPTGFVVADGLLTAAFAGLITLASARARRWTLVWLAGGATAMAIGDPWVVAGAVALVLCAVSITARHRDRMLGALTGACAVQAVLHAPELGFFGLPSLLAAVAVAPVLWSAYVNSSARMSRKVFRVTLVVGALAVVATVGLGVATLTARAQVTSGVATTQKAMTELRAGRQEDAGRLFRQAATEFDAATAALQAPWAWPSRAVPVVGHQAEALTQAARSGRDIATTASTAATAAPYQQLRASNGTIDLDKLQSMRRPLVASADALRAASSDVGAVQTGWLMPPVAEKLTEFTNEIDRALPDVDMAAQAVSVLPQMLGADGTRRYFIAFTNPSETRYQGGFIGAYGELTASDGQVRLTRSGSIEELINAPGAGERRLVATPVYQQRYDRYHPARFLQNLTASPALPTNAAAIAELYPQAGGSRLDGVITVDPYGLAALLKLTGPVTVEGLAQPLTSENAAAFLLKEQYLQGRANSERLDSLTRASKATFDALISRELPSPETIASALGPSVRGGHLQFTAFDRTADQFLGDLGTRGGFVDPGKGDYFDVRVSNAGGNKIDAFLTRTIDYRVTYNPETGKTASLARIVLKNDAPSSGLPEYVIGNITGEPQGTNRMHLSVFTPNRVVRADRDGDPLPLEPQEEFGGEVYSTPLSIPPGGTATIEMQLEGRVATGGYQLVLGHQPLVNDDRAQVSVTSAAGSPTMTGASGLTMSGDRATWSGIVTEPMRFRVDFDSASR